MIEFYAQSEDLVKYLEETLCDSDKKALDVRLQTEVWEWFEECRREKAIER